MTNNISPHTPKKTAAPIIGVVVLGCDKNTADAERFAGALAARMPGACSLIGIAPDETAPVALDALVIYTCAFIHDAKTESIDTILEWTTRKATSGNPRRVYVTGCLAQRHKRELEEEMPEVDGFFGIAEEAQLCRALIGGGNQADATVRRHRLDNRPYAFLKIGDGCNHECAFCAIPGIKGRLRSTPRERVIAEAEMLLASGARELNLVAQDTTAYGRDRYEDYGLASLLADLCAIPGDFWIRCLYCYPAAITDALIHQVAEQPKVVPYLDIPLQHVSPAMLRAMKRPEANQDPAALIGRLRAAIPGLALRTTMMVGFPGETLADHRLMLNAIRTLSFEWLGAFEYSPEEGTPAAIMPSQVGKATRKRRHDAVMRAQAEVTQGFNENRVGMTARVLVEAFDSDMGLWRARSAAEAPEVDGCIFLDPVDGLESGQFVEARFIHAAGYDMAAEIVE